MRITQIQTFNPQRSKQTVYTNPASGTKNSPPVLNSKMDSSPLCDMNYNRILLNKKHPVFTGAIEKATNILAKQLPLEERLADAFTFMKYGDLVVVGKTLKETQKSLIESADKMKKSLIKRAFFIEDDNFKGILAFRKDTLGDTEIINANKKPIFITTDGHEYEIPAQGSNYVIPGDTVRIDDSIVTIKNKPKVDLSMHRFAYAKAFNYEKEAEEVIKNQNRRVLTTLYSEKKPVKKTMFKDVIGQDEVIKELKENILYPLRMPRAYENLDLHHGYILKGAPGLGKTHTAQALINEAGMNYKFLNGLELEQKYVGESEAAWRDLFDEAIDNQPYLLFIDEFDAVGRARGGHDEYGDKVVDQILTCMTDVDANRYDVFVMAATNFFDRLDNALIRSGRFGKILDFKHPDLNATRKLLDNYTNGKPVSETLSKDEIARKMFDLKCTGADVRRLVTDAYLKGYERAGITAKLESNTLTDADLDKFRILDTDFENAIEKFKEGKKPDRKAVGFNK